MIPAIIAAMTTIPKLFSAGKKIYKTVTGKDSYAANEEEFKKEIESLSPEQQRSFIDKMEQERRLYESETERLKADQGEVGDIIKTKVSSDVSDEIAIMRITTRPWVVRKMTHLMLTPYYLLMFDTIQLSLFAWFKISKEYEFRAFDYFMGKLADGTAKTLFGSIYVDTFGYATAIIITYMGLRQVDKFRKGSDDEITNTLKAGAGIVKHAASVLFGKK